MPELVKKDKIKAKVSDKSDKTSNTSSKTKSKPDSESYDPILGPKDRNYFLKYPQSIWYEQAKELPKLDSNEVVDDTDFILEMKAKARDLYEKLASEFEEGMFYSILIISVPKNGLFGSQKDHFLLKSAFLKHFFIIPGCSLASFSTKN